MHRFRIDRLDVPVRAIFSSPAVFKLEALPGTSVRPILMSDIGHWRTSGNFTHRRSKGNCAPISDAASGLQRHSECSPTQAHAREAVIIMSLHGGNTMWEV